jgi:hypothetical protein
MAVVTGYAEVISAYVTAPGALWDGAFRRFCEARNTPVEGEKLQRCRLQKVLRTVVRLTDESLQ